jgi:hypothetical protein
MACRGRGHTHRAAARTASCLSARKIPRVFSAAHTDVMARVTVVLDAEQLAELDAEAKALGISRSAALRRHLDETGPLTPTRETTLAKLEQAAAKGSVTAMTALARELRLGGPLETSMRPRRGRVTVDDLTPDELQAGLRLVP